tara:strand:- start:61 stop:633 length:573 start_codon:yes stop_codon:yes gene_type:complete
MELVFATNNVNKLSEIRSLVPLDVNILSLSDISCYEELPETSNTIEANALQKARYIYDKYGFNCFADDTGLEIDSLDGEPGVYSARYAGPTCNAENNIKKVLYKLRNKKRNARFRTIISLIIDGNEESFEGECLGSITEEVLGSSGFGYDPIFKPSGCSLTFAQMTKKSKGLISHRGISVRKLVDYLSEL